jgi:hypothetical protein
MQMKAVKVKRQKIIERPTFLGLDNEVIAITKPEQGSNLNVQAWKKDGQNFVPALKTIYTISESSTPARLGKLVQKVMADIKEKRKWASR